MVPASLGNTGFPLVLQSSLPLVVSWRVARPAWYDREEANFRPDIIASRANNLGRLVANPIMPPVGSCLLVPFGRQILIS